MVCSVRLYPLHWLSLLPQGLSSEAGGLRYHICLVQYQKRRNLPNPSTCRFRRVGTSTLVASRCRWAPKLALESTGSGEIGAPQLESTLVIPAGEQGPPKSSSETLASLPWQANGYSWWDYKGHRINYVDQGDKDKVEDRCAPVPRSQRFFSNA